MEPTRLKSAIKILKGLGLLALLLLIMLNGNRTDESVEPEVLPAAEVSDGEDTYASSISIPESEYIDQETGTPNERTSGMADTQRAVQVEFELQRLKRQLEHSFDNRVTSQKSNAIAGPAPDRQALAKTDANEDTFANRMTVTLRRDWEAALKSSPGKDSQVLAKEVLAKRMYERGCQFMDSITRKDYALALAFFKKTVEIQPDPNSEYHKKAQERMKLLSRGQPDKG
jgi:hypothetical protein